MASILDATVGDAAANSYGTIAELEAFLQLFPTFWTVWDALDEEPSATGADCKEARAIRATAALEIYDYLGSKNDEDQALSFPRDIQDDATIIPPEVIRAQAKQILYDHYNLASTSSLTADRLIESVDLDGVVAVTFSKSSTSSANKASAATLESVKAELRAWMAGGENSFRWTR